MKIPMQITFHGLPHSEEIESKVTEAAEKLHRIYAEIVSCRVVVDLANRRHKKGNLFRIHIDLSVPGAELNVGREPGDRDAHKDVLVAIRDAFNAMERQLHEHTREKRGEGKRGGPAPHGRVSELLLEDSAGFGEGDNGRFIHPHQDSVTDNGFDRPMTHSSADPAE
jgi:ribosome-associated translation inhibitor RaiA